MRIAPVLAWVAAEPLCGRLHADAIADVVNVPVADPAARGEELVSFPAGTIRGRMPVVPLGEGRL